MTAKILTFNSPKTEFILIRLRQQLAKISSCSLETAHFTCNLGFVSTNIPPFLTRYWLSLNPATHNLAYPSTLPIPWSQNSQHCSHLHRSLQAWLLLLSFLWPT